MQMIFIDIPGGSEVKASAYNVGDLGSIPVLGRSPGEGNGNPLQYSCLENPMDRGAWWATVHMVTKSWTQLSDFTFTFTYELVYYSDYLSVSSVQFSCSVMSNSVTPWTAACQASHVHHQLPEFTQTYVH